MSIVVYCSPVTRVPSSFRKKKTSEMSCIRFENVLLYIANLTASMVGRISMHNYFTSYSTAVISTYRELKWLASVFVRIFVTFKINFGRTFCHRYETCWLRFRARPCPPPRPFKIRACLWWTRRYGRNFRSRFYLFCIFAIACARFH